MNFSKLRNYNQIEFEPTNNCNYRCKICPRPPSEKRGFMSMETFKRTFIEKPLPNNIKAIYVTGYGEPLLNPQTPTFIKILKETYPWIDIILVTNGSLLTKKNITTTLLTAGLTKLRISFLMRGLDHQSYNDMMGGSAEKVIENVKNLVDKKKELNSKTKLVIKNVRLPNYTKEEIDKYRKFWMNIGVDDVKMSNVQSRAGNLVPRLISSSADFGNLTFQPLGFSRF